MGEPPQAAATLPGCHVVEGSPRLNCQVVAKLVLKPSSHTVWFVPKNVVPVICPWVETRVPAML
jgi:hypothetical protein